MLPVSDCVSPSSLAWAWDYVTYGALDRSGVMLWIVGIMDDRIWKDLEMDGELNLSPIHTAVICMPTT